MRALVLARLLAPGRAKKASSRSRLIALISSCRSADVGTSLSCRPNRSAGFVAMTPSSTAALSIARSVACEMRTVPLESPLVNFSASTALIRLVNRRQLAAPVHPGDRRSVGPTQPRARHRGRQAAGLAAPDDRRRRDRGTHGGHGRRGLSRLQPASPERPQLLPALAHVAHGTISRTGQNFWKTPARFRNPQVHLKASNGPACALLNGRFPSPP